MRAKNMQLPTMTLGSRSSSESDRSISITLGSPPLGQKQRGPSSTMTIMDNLEQYNSWTANAVGVTNLRSSSDNKHGVNVGVGRGRLPSIEEIHPASSKFPFKTQDGFSQMFVANNNLAGAFVKRKNPKTLSGQHQGYRPIKDRIIKHGLSESHLRSRVEPILDDTTTNQVLGNGTLDTSSFWLTPASATSDQDTIMTKQHVPRPLPMPSSLTAHRETVTVDGRVRRVRFLSADHTPLMKDDPDFQKLLANKNNLDTTKSNATEGNSRSKPYDNKKIELRSVTVQGARRASVGEMQAKDTKQKVDDHKESPDVWLERARKLRASKEKNNNNTASKADSIGKRSESMKIHDDNTNSENKIRDKIATTSTHVNYCDEKKTQWVKRWLEEVNRQTHFDIIE